MHKFASRLQPTPQCAYSDLNLFVRPNVESCSILLPKRTQKKQLNQTLKMYILFTFSHNLQDVYQCASKCSFFERGGFYYKYCWHPWKSSQMDADTLIFYEFLEITRSKFILFLFSSSKYKNWFRILVKAYFIIRQKEI